MLAYAFQVLNEDSYKNISLENFEYVEDLLAAILAKGIANQTKRGLGREYISSEGILSSPRGKISISSSLKKQTLLKKQLFCEFDEFTENSYINRILKTVAMILISSDGVKQEQKKALKKDMLYFYNIETLNPHHIQWTGIKYHSNNLTYKMLINICYLVVNALLPTTHEGAPRLLQFKDDNMYRLFEKFVLAYYRKHYPEYKASSAQIDWNVDNGFTNLLPVMKTDITLEQNDKKLIIDTKYYSHILQKNTLYDKVSIDSGNLYQIYTYVKNKDIHRSGNVSGVLLYAKTDEEITPDDISYLMDGNRISIKTLDLDKDFGGIRKQLDKVIEEWLELQKY
jgi:5-methylcytosine-specific restriction enzyme subunit McrC